MALIYSATSLFMLLSWAYFVLLALKFRECYTFENVAQAWMLWNDGAFDMPIHRTKNSVQGQIQEPKCLVQYPDTL